MWCLLKRHQDMGQILLYQIPFLIGATQARKWNLIQACERGKHTVANCSN